MTMKADPSAAGKESSTGKRREQRPPSHGKRSVRPCSSPEGVWQEALLLAAAGAHVIPLCGPECPADHPKGKPHPARDAGKVPLVGGWPKWDAPPERAQVEEWGRRWPAGNVGAALGSRAGMVAVDIDNPEGEELLKRLCGDGLPETCEFTTGDGRRLIFLWPWPDRPARTQHLPTGARRLSFEGDGSQTVMPPSRHLNGKVYAWVPGRSLLDREPAEAPPGVVEVFSQPPQPKGRTGTNTPFSGQGGAAAGPEYPQRLWRAERYLEKCDPAVQGEGGDSQTYKVACKLTGKFGLSEKDAYELMKRAYNPRCQPEWSDAALGRKVALAARRHREKPIDLWSEDEFRQQVGRSARRGRAPAPPLPFPARGGEGGLPEGDKAPGGAAPPASPAAGANGHPPPAAGANGQPPPGEPDEDPTVIRLSGLDPLPIKWFLEPFIPRGMITAVVGPPGVGKSTFEAHLASLATRAILMPGEEPIQQLLIPRLVANGVNKDLVTAIPPHENWRFPDCKDRLAERIKRQRVGLVVIDPIDDYTEDGFSDNDPVHVRRVLQGLRTVAEGTGAAVVFCRHPGKDPNNVMVGSRAWGAVPRSIVELVPDPGPPPRRILRHYKDSLGQEADARYFDLIGPKGQAKRWQFAGPVDPRALALAKEEPDRINRLLLDQAKDFLCGFVPAEGVDSRQIHTAAVAEGLKWRTVQQAKDSLGMPHESKGAGLGRRCVWKPPPGGFPDGPA